MLHPATELKFINEEIGLGVFATEFIPKGTILWVFDSLDIIIPMEKFERLSEQIKKHVRKYGYRINPGDFYTLNWDITRYLNHSCRPNSRSIGNYFDIAVRDIQPGEQITVDYGILNYPDLVCLCGEPNCRGLIKANDCTIYYKQWDCEIHAALKLMKSIPQPLYEIAIMQPEIKAIIESYPNVHIQSSKDFYIG